MPSRNAANAVVDEAAPEADKPNGVGPRIKAFRTARRVSLRQLAEMTGTTASFISQLERNLCGASSSTLIRIAAALDLGIKDLFDDSDAPRHKVLRREARPALPVSEGCRKMLLSRRPIHEFEVYAGHFDVGGSTGAEAYTHGGRHEMFVVLKGTVELTLGEERFVLREGDSVEYATSTPHRTANVGDTPAEVLWIIAPPTSGPVELDRYMARKPLASG
ncbi:helix-turn-helix domain-containing protein [Kumtagia ephedrae]|jgi:mannose-6-phosphate isomerase-like protein (cupin superfamily)|uniref:Cupin n=1 Tax=Kumtagia ephedrae TaxID=2116701 RepID=A0A2P7SA51_9HYPH|nr:XRE family transcriptional regulator [Mesorhizobium ephedrae]PSJ59185.1 cupin [Mesorhizobium ephedrae]